ncbi:MAG: hypothetical protein Q4F11_09390, partial [Eubacteriales bacterium]|nr:hypothetical protein [Eubacteriales bacterium]
FKKLGSKLRKKAVFCCILAVVMIMVTMAAYGIYKLSVRKNYILYMSYNDKIFNAASIDSSYVCDESDAVFAADRKTFYIARWPEFIDKSRLTESFVSQNGKYFAATVYDSDAKIYTLYAWSEDGSFEISSGRNSKNVKTVTNEGVIIFSETEVVNLEGNMGDSALFVCTAVLDKSKEKGSQLYGVTDKIEGRLKSAYVYSGSDLIVYSNMDNKLFTYNYDKKDRKPIASVDSFYSMSAETPYLYEAQTSDEIFFAEADSLIYSAGGVYYFYDLEDDKNVVIGKVNGTNISFIYEKKNNCMYIISSGQVEYGVIEEGALKQRRNIDELGNLENTVYIDSKGQLIFINSSNQLTAVHKGITRILKEQVADGSLNRVGNTNEGITYISEKTQYYKPDLSAAETAVCSEPDLTGTADTYLYKNRLYYYNAAGELYSVKKNGEDRTIIGNVDRLWLGTQLK